jgi:hypothetical protein
MDAAEDRRRFRNYNILATFPDRASAEQAVGALKLRGLGEDAVSLRSRTRAPAVAEAEMRGELEGMVAAPGVVASKSMSKGAVGGAVLGAILGAIVGAIVGTAVFGPGSGSRTAGIVIAVVAFAVGLGTAGAVAGGFVKPRYRPEVGDEPEDVEPGSPAAREQPDPAAEVVVSVHVDDVDELASSEDVLVAAGPLRLDVVGKEGQVLNTEETGLGSTPVQPGSGRVHPVEDE